MTAVRWLVDHDEDRLHVGGWIEYPDEATARQHAGTAATVWALVAPEVVRVLETAQVLAAAAWNSTAPRTEIFQHLLDAADALGAVSSTTVDAGTSEPETARSVDTGPADGAAKSCDCSCHRCCVPPDESCPDCEGDHATTEATDG